SEYKKKQFYLSYIEIFDALFIQNKEISNLTLSENSLYKYIRSHYLYAINALNQGDEQTARIEFQLIANYSDKLYMIKEAKEWLENKQV
ncbi:hypothetical protein NHG25_09060, partial [Aerococcaceae bacterium NML191292]|nr:hypothetical protein [Aerococcaceae bacterium NML191292]